MGPRARKAAQDLVGKARNGAIYHGHLGLYKKLQKDLLAARERLAGREDLLQFDAIRQALDAKVEELTAALQDPSVADHVAISEGVYNLLNACQPLYLALSDGLSVKEACDALDEAEATLDDFADQDEAYKKHRRLNGGWVRDHGKWVKLNAKDFAKWQEKFKKAERRMKENPYKRTHQTTKAHTKAFSSEQKTTKRKGDRTRRRMKKARTEEDEPTPPGLEMRVMADMSKKYRVRSYLAKYAPKGYSNPSTTKKKAMKLAALCEANRPAGMGRKAKQAARAEKGWPDGVNPQGPHGFQAEARPRKGVRVVLAAPGGGYLFDSAKAAGKAIEKYEKAGSPTDKSHPLVKYVYRS